MISEERKVIYERLESQVGATLLYEVRNIKIPNGNRIFAKEEWRNPTGSIFDRIYPHLFRVAEKKGYILPEITPVIEASSGNAGASFAWSAKNLGYNATVVIHEDAPKSRIQQIQSYGAKIILSPAGSYAKGFIGLLEQILSEDKAKKGGKIGTNPQRLYCITKINPESKTPLRAMAEEAIQQVPGNIDYLVWTICSGTTISGLGERLKQEGTRVIAIEHESTNVLESLKEGKVWESDILPHKLYGSAPFGVGSQKLDINFEVIDRIVKVSDNDWENGMRLLEEQEGKRVGRSTGAAFSVAMKIAQEVQGKNILTVFFDPAWKYTDNYPYFK